MGVRVVVGENDLATAHPELASQWHPSNNDEMLPSSITPGSHFRAWWKCGQGHDWQAAVKNRAMGQGCPYCSGRRVIPGETDLETLYPELAAQWHPTLNEGLTPKQVSAFSNKKAWWFCEVGHEWNAAICNRAKGSGCGTCTGRHVEAGFNDLATLRPDIAAQWHPTKNGGLTPNQVTMKSGLQAWWICSLGHSWPAKVASRTNGQGCAVCRGLLVEVGSNDLATLRPDIAAQWHPTKNGGLTPNQVTMKSGLQAWWICSLGHSWPAKVASRTNGQGCAVCRGLLVEVGSNDLATLRPDVAANWHPTLNDGLTPKQVTVSSHKKVWWLCDRGHAWTATIADCSQGYGCGVCAGHQIQVGFNDLESVRPDLAAQWHKTKNGLLTPQQVTVSSNKKVWWFCERDHTWPAAVASRSGGTGCPTCAVPGFDPNKASLLYFLINKEFQARKVGIMNVGTKRLKELGRTGWFPVHTVEHGDGRVVAAVEFAFFVWLRKELQLPIFLGKAEMRHTGGWTETFSMEGPSDAEIIARIEAEFAKLEQHIE